MRVLVVDDDEVMRTMICLVLRKLGKMTVEVVSSGHQALETALSFCPDVVLLDLQMPEMDGRATLENIRSHPKLSRLPVIFLTAPLSQEQKEDLYSRNISGILEKPFDPKLLCPRIFALLDNPL